MSEELKPEITEGSKILVDGSLVTVDRREGNSIYYSQDGIYYKTDVRECEPVSNVVVRLVKN